MSNLFYNIIYLSALSNVVVIRSIADDAIGKKFPMPSEASSYYHQNAGFGLDDFAKHNWAVRIKGGPDVADRVAHSAGLVVVDRMEDDFYLMQPMKSPHRGFRRRPRRAIATGRHQDITWAAPQRKRFRSKRYDTDQVDRRDNGFLIIDRMTGDTVLESAAAAAVAASLHASLIPPVNFDNNAEVQYSLKSRKPDDPLWDEEWYLTAFGGPFSMNITEAWKLGYSGQGVVVSVLDDGLEFKNEDLFPNYEPSASFDLNSNDSDPTPRYTVSNENRHGTRCAGVIAMVANNSRCGVGVAFGAKIAAVRMLDVPYVSDWLEARSVTLAMNTVDIYSASWGPADTGATMETPGPLTAEALVRGVTKGRNGRGVIYVWASGNGGAEGDTCAADGYTSSPFVISVNSVSSQFDKPFFSESCPSTLTSTYSATNFDSQKIASVDLRNRCTIEHTGTSASGPIAAGVVALALQANRQLTWRDVQHLIVSCSNPRPLLNDSSWYQNGAGRLVSANFGFGLLDAACMVRLAPTWKSVPPLRICTDAILLDVLPRVLRDGSTVETSFHTNGCYGSADEITFIERTQLVVSAQFKPRGALQIMIISPRGVATVLMPRRARDKTEDTIANFPLTSVHNWGERPKGYWLVRISANTTGIDPEEPMPQAYFLSPGGFEQMNPTLNRPASPVGVITGLRLIFYGYSSAM